MHFAHIATKRRNRLHILTKGKIFLIENDIYYLHGQKHINLKPEASIQTKNNSACPVELLCFSH